MTIFNTHPHAAFDSFPLLAGGLWDEFGEDFEAVADHFIEAELGDFCWDSRIAERPVGPVEDGFDDDGIGLCEEVKILGYFRDRYLVATCIVDQNRRLQWMPRVRYFDDCAEAEEAFAAKG